MLERSDEVIKLRGKMFLAQAMELERNKTPWNIDSIKKQSHFHGVLFFEIIFSSQYIFF